MSSEILQFATQYSLYSGCILFSLGIIGNALNILIFTRLKVFRNNQYALYIIVESISNVLYQINSIVLTILTLTFGDDATGRSPIWCRLRFIIGQICGILTSYTICFAAVDQFFSTNYQFNLRQICTLKFARYLTFIFTCGTIAHSIAFGFAFDIQPSVGCAIPNPNWLQYSTYFVYPVLVGLLPITTTLFFGILAYQNVRRIVRRQIPIVRRRLDQQITAMVLMRGIIYVCLATPFVIYRIYIINFPFLRTKPFEYAIGRLLQAIVASVIALNYTASFYLYWISSSRFRRQVKLFLIKKIWKQIKSLFYCGDNGIVPETGGELRVANIELEDVD